MTGLALAALVMIIIIGFRYQVGTDFPNYTNLFRDIARRGLAASLDQTDVAYVTLNWIAAQLGASLWLVNLVCAVLFTWGLIQFAKIQPNPWLAITIAIPYLVIVVAMGYTRQGVAIGLSMAGLAAVSRGSFRKFVAYVFAGALFHKTAFVLIPIVTMAYTRNRLLAVAIGAAGTIASYYLLISGEGFERFQDLYITRAMESQGTAIRLAMNIPPALLFMLYTRKFTNVPEEKFIYLLFSLIALASIIIFYYIKTSSTALDRMGLYIIPLQVMILSRLPNAFGGPDGRPSGPLIFAIVCYSAAVEFVWLNYGRYAQNWIPYRFYPLF
jgi:hypothetical protein